MCLCVPCVACVPAPFGVFLPGRAGSGRLRACGYYVLAAVESVAVFVRVCVFVWVWVDGCEVRPCDPFARVRPCVPCVPCVSRLPRCLFTGTCRRLFLRGTASFQPSFAVGASDHADLRENANRKDGTPPLASNLSHPRTHPHATTFSSPADHPRGRALRQH